MKLQLIMALATLEAVCAGTPCVSSTPTGTIVKEVEFLRLQDQNRQLSEEIAKLRNELYSCETKLMMDNISSISQFIEDISDASWSEVGESGDERE
jgi:hypothetical protein